MDGPADLGAADRLREAAYVLDRQNEPGVRLVADGIRAYLSGAAASLDEALELKTEAGHRRPSTMARIAERDALLRRAANQFFPGPNTSHQARELHTAISRYAASSWPRERERVTCPDRRTGTIQGAAWEILSLDDHVLSFERIRKILVTS